MTDAPQLGLGDIVVPSVILVVILLLSRTRVALTWGSPLRNRLILFAVGALSTMVLLAIRAVGTIVALSVGYGSLVRSWLEVAFISGLEWIVFFEILRRARGWFGNDPIRQFVGLLALIWVLEGPVYVAISIPLSLLPGRPLESLGESAGSFWQSFKILAHYPYNIFNLLDAVTFLGVSYCVGGARSPQAWFKNAKFWQSGHFGGTGGYQDMEMSPSNSHTTRLLCASAFLGGSAFRDQVLKYLDDPSRAVAPELGTDLRLVAQMCKFVQNRDRKFDWFFAACVLLALFGAAVDPTLGLVVFVVSGAAVDFAKRWPEHFAFVRPFSKPVFDPQKVANQFHAELEPEQSGSLPAEDQNLIVYQGFSPFVGAGMSLGGWSFVVNVEKGKEDSGPELEPFKFQTAELYAEIERSIGVLGLNGLSQRDMFFVHGSDIRDDRNILQDSYGRPFQKLSESQAQKYAATNDSRVRHYKWLRIMDWGNELVTSYFLRFTLRGSNLFVEINRYLLTPLAGTYRRVDALAEEDWKKRMAVGLASLVVGPVKALFSPLVLFARVQEYVSDMFDQKEKHRRELIDDNPLYNYGVARSFREATGSDQFMHYFQKLDGDFYSKVLEREVLAAIVDFLDEHNVDTSELKERQSTILNSGIIIHGGDVKAESLAVGTAAQAIKVSRPEPLRTRRLRRAAAGEP